MAVCLPGGCSALLEPWTWEVWQLFGVNDMFLKLMLLLTSIPVSPQAQGSGGDHLSPKAEACSLPQPYGSGSFKNFTPIAKILPQSKGRWKQIESNSWWTWTAVFWLAPKGSLRTACQLHWGATSPIKGIQQRISLPSWHSLRLMFMALPGGSRALQRTPG